MAHWDWPSRARRAAIVGVAIAVAVALPAVFPLPLFGAEEGGTPP